MRLIGKSKKGSYPAESVESTSAQRARIETLVAGRGDEIIQRTKEKISAELTKLALLKNRAKAMVHFD